MSNLLDKSSIVLTPTAYDNGKVLCVKPSDGSGDFDFSRNSAATRVNAQGLVEDVQILSSNLVQNGSFSQLGSEEITNGNFSQQGSDLTSPVNFLSWSQASIDSRTANSFTVGGSGRGLYYLLPENKTLKIKVSGLTGSAEIRLRQTASGAGTVLGSTDTNLYVTTTNATTNLYLRATQAGTVSVTDVSVVEVGQDWSFGTGWSVGDNVANCDGTQTGGTSLYQSALQQNKSYKITFSITSITAGGVGVVNSPKYTTTGTFTYYYNVTGTDSNLYVNANTDFIGSVTNISVKEVGQNWTFSGGAVLQGESVLFAAGGNSIFQSFSGTLGKKYKLSINKNGGTLRYRTGFAGADGTLKDINTTAFFTATSDTNRIQFFGDASNVNTTLNSLSLIEITDDTNLPRINYDGFSYQDALGSELVTGGDFSNPSDWTLGVGWSISGGSANGLSTSDVLQQSISSVVGKVYEITGDAVVNSGSLRVFLGGLAGNIISTGSFKIQFSPNNTNPLIFTGISFTGSIDNVSVKEYLGQEVVPDSGCGSWLWEPQSTNLIPYSELFSNAAWLKSQITILQNDIVSPSGLTDDAYMVSEDNTNTFHRLRLPLSLSNNTLSVFAKKGTIDKFMIWISGLIGVGFDLTLGTINSVSGVTPPTSSKIEDYGNGWYRCSVSYPSSSGFQIFTLEDFSGYSYQGNTANNFYIYAAQAENQSYATSYIPTSGQASGVTRNQDVCTNGGSAASINSTEGVLYFEGSVLENTSSFEVISLSDGGASNILGFVYRNIANQFTAVLKSGGSTSLSKTITLADATATIKAAISYKLNDFKFYVNGVLIIADTTGNTPIGLNTLQFADGNGTSNKFFGKTKAVAVWKEALTDTELQELTTI